MRTPPAHLRRKRSATVAGAAQTAASAHTPPWLRALPSVSLALLAAATLAAFAGVLRNGWVLLDDPDYVFANPHINRGLTLAGLRWILHSPHGGNWHPLTSVLHMLDVQVFGLQPAGHHAVSLALHALNAVLLALALRRLTGAWWRSVLVAALFALHPLRVESVAWAAELKDVLSGTFFMLVLLAYAAWAERPGLWRQGQVIALLALGLMAKPMLVTVPFVLVILDVWPLGRLRWLPLAGQRGGRRGAAPARDLGALVLEKWPLLLLVVVFSVIAVMAQHASGAVATTGSLPLAARALNAALSYWRYLGLLVWPHALIPTHRLVGGHDLLRGTLAALALAGSTAVMLRLAPRRPWLLAGWLWYLGSLLPVIGLVQVGQQSHADRYTYLPGIGVLIALVWSAAAAWPRGRTAETVAAVTACSVLALLATLTAAQVARWRDNRTLFSYVVGVEPGNLVAHQCLGSELLAAGDARGAIPHFEAALRAAPENFDSHINLGDALGMLDRSGEAIVQFREALRLRDDASAHQNLGLTLGKLGRADEAITEYQAALRLEPEHVPSLLGLGVVFGSQGRFTDADAAFRKAVVLRPEDADTRRLLAVTLTHEDSVEAAIAQYRELARRDGADLDALNNIAWIRATHADARHRNGAEAVRFAEQARDRSAEPLAVLYSTLAAAYAEVDRMSDARLAGARAVELARAERDTAAAARYSDQLACYRAGRPFHFAR